MDKDTNIRLCVECAHFQPNPAYSAEPFCAASKRIDRVFGEHSLSCCSVQRTSPLAQDCGPDGRKWQAAKPADAYAFNDGPVS